MSSYSKGLGQHAAAQNTDSERTSVEVKCNNTMATLSHSTIPHCTDQDCLIQSMREKHTHLERIKGAVSLHFNNQTKRLDEFVKVVHKDLKELQRKYLSLLDQEFDDCLGKISKQQEEVAKLRQEAEKALLSGRSEKDLLSSRSSNNGIQDLILKLSTVELNWNSELPAQIMNIKTEQTLLDIDKLLSADHALPSSCSALAKALNSFRNGKPSAISDELAYKNRVKDFTIDCLNVNNQNVFKPNVYASTSLERLNNEDLGGLKLPSELITKTLDRVNTAPKEIVKQQREKEAVHKIGSKNSFHKNNTKLASQQAIKHSKSRDGVSKNNNYNCMPDSGFGIPKSVSKTVHCSSKPTNNNGSPTKERSHHGASNPNILRSSLDAQIQNSLLLTKEEQIKPRKAVDEKQNICRTQSSSVCIASPPSQTIFATTGDSSKYSGIHNNKKKHQKATASTQSIPPPTNDESDDIYYEYLRGKLNLKKSKPAF
jgi:hypothetical protein